MERARSTHAAVDLRAARTLRYATVAKIERLRALPLSGQPCLRPHAPKAAAVSTGEPSPKPESKNLERHADQMMAHAAHRLETPEDI